MNAESMLILAGVQGWNLLTGQPDSMEAGILRKHFFKGLLSLTATFKSMPSAY
jgi:hypothetical protein